MIMMMPAMIDSVSKYCAMVLPTTLAVAPSPTKTVVKPSTKATAARTILRFCATPALSSFNSSKLTPASQAR